MAGYIGDFQSRLLLTLFYFTIALPVGVVVRLFGDPLKVRKAPPGSGWSQRPERDSSLQGARKQF